MTKCICTGIGFTARGTGKHDIVLIGCEHCRNKAKEELKNARTMSQADREIYKDADSFMENESKLQWQADYPNTIDFLKANGSKIFAEADDE